MRFIPNFDLPEIIMIDPDIHGDERGHFLETYQAHQYAKNRIPDSFVQDNLSYSKRGVLRGLHYQLGTPQGKLVWVVDGEVFDVSVDIRQGSPTFGKWVGVTLSSKKYSQVFVPPGFAHGFCVISKTATLLYKCTDYYAPKAERGIQWNDPALGIDWPVTDPILSEKDRTTHPPLKKIPRGELPVYSDMPSGRCTKIHIENSI
jgi:dTDP-4-dehydrorhamnose 3,5-epimerase